MDITADYIEEEGEKNGFSSRSLNRFPRYDVPNLTFDSNMRKSKTEDNFNNFDHRHLRDLPESFGRSTVTLLVQENYFYSPTYISVHPVPSTSTDAIKAQSHCQNDCHVKLKSSDNFKLCTDSDVIAQYKNDIHAINVGFFALHEHPVIWTGSLLLKTMVAETEMHFLSGNVDFVKFCLASVTEDHKMYLTNTLEMNNPLFDKIITKQMTNVKNFSTIIAVPQKKWDTKNDDPISVIKAMHSTHAFQWFQNYLKIKSEVGFLVHKYYAAENIISSCIMFHPTTANSLPLLSKVDSKLTCLPMDEYLIVSIFIL